MSDPYNRNGPEQRGDALLAEMERVWRECVNATPQPEFMLIPQWLADWLDVWNACPPHQRGTEHWWYV